MQAALAQEEPGFASVSAILQAEPGIPGVEGAESLAFESYPALNAWAVARAGLRGTSAAYPRTPIRLVAGAHVLAGRTSYEGTRGGTFANALNRFVPAGNRSAHALNAALIALYEATNGENWTNNTNWDINAMPTSVELDTWWGVTVRQGEIYELRLDDNNLTGTLPTELGDLSSLSLLSLDRNSLSGEIPKELGDLSQLVYLSLDRNSLSGEIPKELGDLAQLRLLYLDTNRLSGEIPKELGNLPKLETLFLYGNSLSGEIPKEFGNLSELQMLFLSQNSLSGEIPKEFGNLTKLQSLSLFENSLSGEIPIELTRLSQLQQLLLAVNKLSGEIPKELGNLPRLHALWLEKNSFSGPIPVELGKLSDLTQLTLQYNSLSGGIPKELGNLSQLEHLRLNNNALSGAVPKELGSLSQLEVLALNDNNLAGSLPRSLLQLTNLKLLHFEGQALCAPSDDAFQAWLSSIPNVSGPTCAAVQFAGDVENQTYTVRQAISDLVLPEASGGVATLSYMLEPPLPAGLVFDDASRTISGTPTAPSSATSYTFSATDNAGSLANLTFTIEVVTAVAFQEIIADQSFPRAQPITPLVFPEATGGVPPIEYQLTPSLPTGLDFDAAIRILTGTPTEVTSGTQPYTYSATGANGSTDSLQFTLEVYSPVATEREALPESFAVRGNYPNPFRQSTRLIFDLPWPARVTVEVMDLTGRRVLAVPAVSLATGWEHGITLTGSAMSSGLYLYRLTATSPEGSSIHVGRFVRVR